MVEDLDAAQKATNTLIVMLEKRLDGISGDIKSLADKVNSSLLEAEKTKTKVDGLISVRNWVAALLVPILAAAVITFFLNVTANTRNIQRLEQQIPAPPASTLEQYKK